MQRLPEPPSSRMTRAEYRAWVGTQPRGRWELVDGEVIAMAPERVAHNRVKMRTWQAFNDAIQQAGLRCEAFGDGVSVEIGSDTEYEPDVVVHCGDRLGEDSLAAPNPVIVVEVLSPSSRRLDTTLKLTGYFSIPSIIHYLIVRPDRPQVVHHRRGDGGILTAILTGGLLHLHPPGLTVDVTAFYPAPRASAG